MRAAHLVLARLARSTRRLKRDRQGVAAIEFGFVAPVLAMFMMGIGDLIYTTYVQSILVGAVQKAGRDATLQANATTAATNEIDAAVMVLVRKVSPNATYVSTRESYSSFSNVDKPEPFEDKSGPGATTGVYDAGIDCFTDLNGNDTYDLDGGRSGVGGANDIAQYKITVTIPRLFPVATLLGFPTHATAAAETLLKNQPYAGQVITAETVCP
jgi:Flp pilus assembly protein TadG